jgi:hypothetical protein
MNPPPNCVDQRSTIDKLFTPQWAGGWAFTRQLFVFAGLLEYGWRVTAIEDAYAAPDMVFASGFFRLADYITLGPTTGYLLWTLCIVGLFCVSYGGKLMRPGLLMWAIGAWTLLGYEALNVKAHDRLLAWIAIGLLISPAHERGLARKYRSPIGRYFLLIAFCAIYGSTGLAKHLHEPSWWRDGEVLAYHLLNFHHGGNLIAVWVSSQGWLVWGMSLVAVAFELTFPFLIWFRKTNPWILLIAVNFHLGTLFLMDVGPFAFVSVAAYPVLLDPELARGWWERFTHRYPRSRSNTL